MGWPSLALRALLLTTLSLAHGCPRREASMKKELVINWKVRSEEYSLICYYLNFPPIPHHLFQIQEQAPDIPTVLETV